MYNARARSLLGSSLGAFLLSNSAYYLEVAVWGFEALLLGVTPVVASDIPPSVSFDSQHATTCSDRAIRWSL